MPDLRAGPPPRWRVVEHDRRLVVIDTASGVPAAQPDTAGTPVSQRRWVPRRTKFDGSAELTTLALYDDKGPRTIKLVPADAAVLGRVKLIAIALGLVGLLLAISYPWLLLPIAFVLVSPRPRAIVRGATTLWLDRAEHAG